MRLEMFADEKLTWWFPFDGLPVGATPDVQIASGSWVQMTLDAAYNTDLDADDPNKASAFYKVTFSGPDSSGGIAVPVGWWRVSFRVSSGGLTDVQPNPGAAAIWLAVTRRNVAA